ncbi:MAG TPA: hypothetical protein VK866_12765 [Acidimicrobiales bacterium]|nr:hypothetical protein [Acidimicrobiales bacterium]
MPLTSLRAPVASETGAARPRPTTEVVTVTALTWAAGLEHALVAVHRARCAGHDVRWRIHGDGPERERVVFTIHDLGLDEVVTLGAPLGGGDLYLHPRLDDEVGDLAHWLAVGGRAVATDGRRVRELAVRHPCRLWRVPRRDPAAMARTLVEAG